MDVYGAEHHLMILSDAIDADVHQHTFLQMTLALDSPFEMEIEGERVTSTGIIIDSQVSHSLNGHGQPLLLLLMDSTTHLAQSFKPFINGNKYYPFSEERFVSVIPFIQKEYSNIQDSDSYHQFLAKLAIGIA